MIWKLDKVVSGGQTGADQAGLIAAFRCGIPTGGWIPKGCKTLKGPAYDMAAMFGLLEHSSDKYPPRTFCNVRDSDGTMRFAADFDSAGELCTLKAIKQYKKPYFDVNLIDLDPDSLDLAVAWIAEHNIRVLNVAGNSHKTHPNCGLKVTQYLSKLFQRLGYEI